MWPERVEAVGARAHVVVGELQTVIGAIGDQEHVANLNLDGAPGVDHTVPISRPYKLASSQVRHGERTVIDVDGRRIGGAALRHDRRAVHGRVARRDARRRARGQGRGRPAAARRRLQAAHLALLLPGPR